MGKKLKAQLDNKDEIKDVLRRLPLNYSLASGESVKTLLLYLPYKNGAYEHCKLFEVVKNTIFTKFALRQSEIERKLNIESTKATEELFNKSLRKISKTTAKGELGELLLYTLMDVYLNAPKILSKISMKTSPKMPVYGVDAVHLQYVRGGLRLYLGEAKMHTSYSGAVSSAIKSLSEIDKKYEFEFDLIESYIDFPELDDDIKSDILNLLNPFVDYSEKADYSIHSPCFIGFGESTLFDPEEDMYKKKYEELAKRHIEAFYQKLIIEDEDKLPTTVLMLLPFDSLDDFVDEFIEYMGIV